MRGLSCELLSGAIVALASFCLDLVCGWCDNGLPRAGLTRCGGAPTFVDVCRCFYGFSGVMKFCGMRLIGM